MQHTKVTTTVSVSGHSPGHTPSHPASLRLDALWARGAAGERRDSRDWEVGEQRKEKRKRN